VRILGGAPTRRNGHDLPFCAAASSLSADLRCRNRLAHDDVRGCLRQVSLRAQSWACRIARSAAIRPEDDGGPKERMSQGVKMHKHASSSDRP